MRSVCNFIPQQQQMQGLQFVHFVYETNVRRLSQPFLRPDFYMHLVDKGTATLRIGVKEIALKKGDLFFTFPNKSYSIEADNHFTFLYISFNGERALPLLRELQVSEENFWFEGFEHMLQFWMDSIIRVHPSNAYLLAESVFTYTLSFLNDAKAQQSHKEKIDFVLEYVEHNYAMRDMSIKKVAGIFFYNEKYLSALFAKKTGVKFARYVNDLRVRHAQKLMEEGEADIAHIAERCGYADRFYFSKVFKSITGLPPQRYISFKEKA